MFQIAVLVVDLDDTALKGVPSDRFGRDDRRQLGDVDLTVKGEAREQCRDGICLHFPLSLEGQWGRQGGGGQDEQ
jgi:hypothetical protein